MKFMSHISVLIYIFLASNIAFAGNISNDSLEKIMDLSGLNQQVHDYPESIILGIEQNRKKDLLISEIEFTKIKMIIKSSFNPFVILKSINKQVKKDISEDEAQDLLKWYCSKPGITITNSEKEASKPDAYNEMIKNSKILLSNKEMINYAIMIDRLVKSTDFAIELQDMLGIVSFSVIYKIRNPNSQIKLYSYKEQISRKKDMIRKNIRQLIILSYVYCYKNIDRKILEEYIQFLKQPITQKFHESVLEAMKNSLNNSFHNMIKFLDSKFPRNNNQVNNRIKGTARTRRFSKHSLALQVH